MQKKHDDIWEMLEMKILDNINHRLYSQNVTANDIWQATQPELDALEANIWRIFNNTRVTFADIEGIEIWEFTYDILPDLHSDSKEERRDRILEMKRMQPPFTELWLRDQLSRRVPAESRATLTIEPDPMNSLRMYLVLSIPFYQNSQSFMQRRYIRELLPWMRHVIPANIMLFFKVDTAPIDLENSNYVNIAEVSFEDYDFWNITKVFPMWNGVINWDGSHIFTPRQHGIGFEEVGFEGYGFRNILSRPTATIEYEFLWNGAINFDGRYNFTGTHIEAIF